MLAQAVTATKSLDHKTLANYIHSHEMKTIVGGLRFDAGGEWEKPRVVFIQFQGVTDRNIDQFRKPGKQVIVAPDEFKTAEVRPFSELRN